MKLLARTAATGGRFRLFAALACAVTFVSGCSTGSPGEDPYANDFEAALEGSVSDFEREAFADGELTRSEYDRAHELWLDCMEETFPSGGKKVVDLTVGDDGLYQYRATGFEPADEQFYDAVHDECAQGTIAVVAPLYGSLTLNPEKLDAAALLVACLTRTGVVPESYTVENLHADMGSLDNLDAATGLDLESDGFRACVADPQHSPQR